MQRESGPRAADFEGCARRARAIPRPHMAVTDAGGTNVGEVTSGTFSPTERVGIALGS
jgi:aminomethyltransferase